MNGLAKLTYRALLPNACLFKRKWILTNEDDQNNTEQRLDKMKLAQSFLVLFRTTKLLLYDEFLPFLNPKNELFLSNSNFISIFQRFVSAEYTVPKVFTK